MKRSLVMLLGVLVVPFVTVACGGGDVALDDSPEADAFRYRQSVMRAIEWKVIELRAMADGEVPVDEEQFKESAHELAALSGMITEGFLPGSDVAGSAAQPAVWESWDDFVAEAEQFEAGVREFAETAETGGFAAAQGMVQTVGQSCGDCHRPYRRRGEG